jgi:hypothetical protein
VRLGVEESTARREVIAALREYNLAPHIARIEALPEGEFDEELSALPPELMGVRRSPRRPG